MGKPSVWELRIPQMVEMRRSGYTLQEIGDCFGVTRERIRQILQENCGKIEIPLLTETMVAKEIGCPIGRLRKLRIQGLVKPRHRRKNLHYYDKGELENVKLALRKHCSVHMR